MRARFLRRRRLYLALAAELLLLAAYLLCRGNRGWMNALTGRVTLPLQRFLGRLCRPVPFSVMEALLSALVLLALVYVVWSGAAVARAGEGAAGWERWKRRGRRAYAAALGGVCAVLAGVDLCCLMWGALFWADSFQDRSGLRDAPVSREDLRAVTAYFAREASRTAEGVARDENGLFAVPVSEILARAPEVYDGVEAVYPFLAFEDVGVKPMFFSRLMSRMDFTGFYCSCTGEANVNVDCPACLIPATAAHEMAHQRGIASEQECNFLAVLSSVTSGDPVYTYSGYLMGYLYLGNALWQADPEAYREICSSLPDTVRADLACNNAYWDQFRDTVARTVSNKVYDGILKGYGDQRGIRSYGAMVDLLAAYYAGFT